MENEPGTNRQSRNWVFTLNNYTPEDVTLLQSICEGGNFNYVAFGREVGENGTPHLQGYLQTNRRIRLSYLKNNFHRRAHFEVARGTPAQAVEYCRKDGAFEEYGTLNETTQGRSSNLGGIVKRLQSGTPLRDLAIEDPTTYCRHRNGLRDIAGFIQSTKREFKSRVIWIWGEPGTGKSQYAHYFNPDFWSYGGDGWFDGYEGQSLAIFDDFCDDEISNGRAISYGLFLKLCDRYPLRVPVKGGFAEWRPKTIIFTSNRDPRLLYSKHYHDPDAIARRLDQILHFE